MTAPSTSQLEAEAHEQTPLEWESFAFGGELARTGLSVVFVAQTEQSGKVCVKTLKLRGERDREAAAMFRREAAMLSRVEHPSIVSVLGAGERREGPWLCLEFVDGRPLAELVGKLEPVDAVAILIQIAEGLSAIHGAGILHRDLKPANVVVQESPSGPTCKIIDFGLAADTQGVGDALVGSLHYIAPELTGLVQWPVGPSADLYALGVTAFELLSGQVPFDAEDPGTLLRRHVAEAPADLADLRGNVPKQLAAVVHRLLEKEPASRYSSAESLAHDLRRIHASLQANEVPSPFALDTETRAIEALAEVFVGRTDELGLLEASLARAENGLTSAVYVEGPAGVGKSGLLRQFSNRAAAAGAIIARGRCYGSTRGLPFYGVVDLLTHLVSVLAREPEGSACRAFVTALRELPGDLLSETCDLVPAIVQLLDEGAPHKKTSLPDAIRRQRLIGGLAGLLTAAAPDHGTLVLLLEDLHWADQESLEVLATAMDESPDRRVLFAHSLRPVAKESGVAGHVADSIKARGRRRLILRPLWRSDVTHLVAAALGVVVGTIPEALVEIVQQRTDGNPLFVIEVLRFLVEEGIVTARAGALTVDEDELERVDLPASAVHLVLARVKVLSAETQALLGAAAVAGREFTLPLAAAGAGLELDEAARAITEAGQHKLVERMHRGELRFQHDRVRDACARLVSRNDRADVHGRLLAWFSANPATSPPLYELAEHAVRSKQAEAIWKWALAAGREARERQSNQTAAAYLRHALDAASELSIPARELDDVRMDLASVLDLLGEYGEALAIYDELLERVHDPARRARVCLYRSRSLQRAGNYPDAVDAGRRGLSLLDVDLSGRRGRLVMAAARGRYWVSLARNQLSQRKPDRERTVLVVELLQQLWHTYLSVDAEAVPYVSYRALEFASRLGESRELMVCHRLLCVALPQLREPNYREAIRHGKRSIALAEKFEEPYELALGLLFLSVSYCWSGSYREALQPLVRARELLAESGNAFHLGNTHIFSFIANRALGRLDECIGHGEALLGIGEKTSANGTIANAHQKLADILRLRGQSSKADFHLGEALRLCEQHKLKFDSFQTHKTAGLAATLGGNWSEARRHFAAAIALAERPGTSFMQAYLSEAYLGYAEAVVRDADHLGATGGVDGAAFAKAKEYVEACLGRERRTVGQLGLAQRASGFLLWAQGKRAAAVREYERALAALANQGRDLDVAQLQLDAGRLIIDNDPKLGEQWMRAARQFGLRSGAKAISDVALEVLTARGMEVEQAGGSEPDKRRLRAIEELVDVSRALMESRDVEQALERIIDASINLFGAERGFVFGYDDENDRLELRATRTADGRAIEPEEQTYSETVLEQVQQTGRGLAVSDTGMHGALQDRHSVIAYDLRSVMCVPLDHARRRLGLLYLDSRINTAVFGEDDLALLDTFAAQAAIALENAQHIAATQRHARELDQKVKDRTEQLELANVELRTSMRKLKETTLHLAEARREALEKEMSVARSIQRSILPANGRTLSTPGGEVCGLVRPASECGGDFWACATVGDQVVLFIGDVTGHGVGSALLTAAARSCFDTLVLERRILPLDNLMRRLHEVVAQGGDNRITMTGFSVAIDHAQRTLAFSAAGHLPQYLLRTSGSERTVEPLISRSRPLGSPGDAVFATTKTTYEPGDVLLLHTDGVTEAVSERGKQYGGRRFLRRLREVATTTAATTLLELDADLLRFQGERVPEDDITLVATRLR